MSKLPRYDERRGWHGGDSRTLYAFTDARTGRTVVRPGHVSAMRDVGPAVSSIRVATRDEAERLWQSPLHAGWTVAP